jgi:hypothetical protein
MTTASSCSVRWAEASDEREREIEALMENGLEEGLTV